MVFKLLFLGSHFPTPICCWKGKHNKMMANYDLFLQESIRGPILTILQTPVESWLQLWKALQGKLDTWLGTGGVYARRKRDLFKLHHNSQWDFDCFLNRHTNTDNSRGRGDTGGGGWTQHLPGSSSLVGREVITVRRKNHPTCLYPLPPVSA